MKKLIEYKNKSAIEILIDLMLAAPAFIGIIYSIL